MNKEIHKTSIGGQAVIEGVMMRGPKEIAVAVRKSDGEIVVDKQPVASVIQKYKFLKLPIIRGVVSFIESMVVGIKTLMFSAELYDTEEDDPTYKPSKFDLWLEKVFGNKDVLVYTSLVISMVLAMGLFVLLPALITKYSTFFISNNVVKSLIEGVVRMGIFILYIFLVSRTKEMQRVFQYHGAEHKSIACYEHGEELTVENVRKYTRFHPRCGTSFLIEVMIISVIVFSFLSWDNIFVRILTKLALMPVVAGLAYEVIKLAGRYDNKIMGIVNKPGLWLQRLTTREPDDSQLEVAIRSLTEVLTGNREDDKW